MAVIDKNIAEKASQDKSQETANRNNASNPQSSQDVTSIQDIAEKAFNTSYNAVGNVIRMSSKAGVERAIADYQRDIASFERAFEKDFLQTIEAKSEPYAIATSALHLLSASGADPLQKVCDRHDYLADLEEKGLISEVEKEELDLLHAQLKEAGRIVE